jgi:hypothetical protein
MKLFLFMAYLYPPAFNTNHSGCNAHGREIGLPWDSLNLNYGLRNTYSCGDNTYSRGDNVYSCGDNTHSRGDNTHSRGDNVYSRGDNTYSRGDNTHSRGDNTYSRGESTYFYVRYPVYNYYNHDFKSFNIKRLVSKTMLVPVILPLDILTLTVSINK